MTEDSVIWLEEVGKEDIAIVGGKGASLGEMLRAELPVPTGFAVTTQAFRRFIDENGINDELFTSLEVDVDNADKFSKTENKTKKNILVAEMRDVEETKLEQQGDKLSVKGNAILNSDNSKKEPTSKRIEEIIKFHKRFFIGIEIEQIIRHAIIVLITIFYIWFTIYIIDILFRKDIPIQVQILCILSDLEILFLIFINFTQEITKYLRMMREYEDDFQNENRMTKRPPPQGGVRPNKSMFTLIKKILTVYELFVSRELYIC